MGARVTPIYGGQPITRQLGALSRGVDVVVATPGRALDHIARGSLKLHELRTVVLDEADEMLDMGFAEDLEAIFDATPDQRQTVLFSATMPPRIEQMARRRLRDPERITIDREPASADGPLVRQSAYIVARAHKPAALGRVLDVESPTAALVFCRTRAEVDQLAETLNGRGYRAEALHGGMTQDQRDRVMARLRNEVSDLIVATDVAARGLDIDQLTSTTTCRPIRTPTRTGSAVSAAPGARAWRSRWPSRASTGCSRRSSASRARGSRSRSCRRSPTCAHGGSR